LNRKTKRIIGKTLLFFALTIISLIIIVPLLIMIFGSFKNPLEVTSFNLELPEQWLFTNYLTVIREGKVGRAFLNSMLITVLSVCLTIFCSSMASFILARKKSKKATFLYYFFFMGTIAPMQVIPTIKILQIFQIYGTYLSAIFVYCTLNLSLGCFLYTGFIKGIPKALDEAAIVEGAPTLKVFFRIIFPLLKPVNMTVLIIVFMNVWNDINIPLYFLPNPSKWTMPLSVYSFFGQYSGSNWNLVFANLTLSIIPIMVLYLFAQRYIVSGLVSGAVK
jgi:raffinose/stachyose/melibiose transport system permease protein